MTDNEIIKALECCNRNGSCGECPYDRARFEHEPDCASEMTANALDLINRQRAEIDDLTRDTIPKLRESLRRANKYGMEANKEIERLRKYHDDMEDAIYSLREDQAEVKFFKNKIRAEAVKELERELVDRLVDVAVLKDNGDGTASLYIRTWDVRKILKEMVGEQK